jgi:hypothetical protein
MWVSKIPGDVIQCVDSEGSFNREAVANFVKDQGLEYAGVDYQVVAIMGPQSSGKSTLLNALVRLWILVRNLGLLFCSMCLERRRRLPKGEWCWLMGVFRCVTLSSHQHPVS